MVKDRESIEQEIEGIQEQVDKLKRKLDSLVAVEAEDRYRTFIKGFDERIGGGLPGSHVVLLSGPSGTMKTSIALNMLSRNVQQGVSGVYLTLEESKESLLRTAGDLGIELDKASIVDVGEMRRVEEIAEDAGNWLEIIAKYLQKAKEKKGISIVVLDSLDSLLSLGADYSPRDALSGFFHSLRDLGVTSLVIDEAETENEFPSHEDRMADGNIFVTFDVNFNEGVRLLVRCLKMRHTKHSRDYYHLNFENGEFFLTELGAQ